MTFEQFANLHNPILYTALWLFAAAAVVMLLTGSNIIVFAALAVTYVLMGQVVIEMLWWLLRRLRGSDITTSE